MDNSRIEEYIKSVKLPEYESTEHRQELRRKLLNEIARRQKMTTKKRALRIVYIVAALVCISALAIAGVTHSKWRFRGKRDGRYTFTPEQQETTKDGKAIFRAFSISSKDPNFQMSEEEIKQAEKDIEEMNRLAAEGKREIVKVIDTELAGEVDRMYSFKYVLSDGREKTVGSDDGAMPPSFSVDVKEIWKLRKEGKGEKLDPVEKEVRGRIFVFDRQKIKLSDGREIIHSIGEPKEQQDKE
jgi:hypothetical protein